MWGSSVVVGPARVISPDLPGAFSSFPGRGDSFPWRSLHGTVADLSLGMSARVFAESVACYLHSLSFSSQNPDPLVIIGA